MSDFDSSFDPQPPIFSDLKPQEPAPESHNSSTSSISDYPGTEAEQPSSQVLQPDIPKETGEYVYINPNPIQQTDETSSQSDEMFDNIPECIFQEDSEEYERMQQAMSSGKNAAKMSFNFGCVALGLYFFSYCANCCCCFGSIFQLAALICAVIGLIYGIIGIKRTREYGTDSNATTGVIFCSAILILYIGGMILSILYYAVSFGTELIVALPELLEDLMNSF